MSDAWALQSHPNFAAVPGPVLVVVMDGVGQGRCDEGDAVWLARTPTLDWLAAQSATLSLRAHGTAVGLPSDKDMGNSEVGHNALGAGRVFDQGAKLVEEAIASGKLFDGATWREGVERVRQSGQAMHFIGLLSDGNVHSHIDHLLQMLRRCRDEQVRTVRVHVLLDGRDVSETSGLKYLAQLESALTELSTDGFDYRIASGGGRMTTTMDRYEADWSIVERGWRAHVLGEARGFASAREAVETFRAETPGISDQFLPEFVIVDAARPVGPIRDGSTVVFFNFRGDRAIEITRAFEEEAFVAFDRGARPDVFYAGMMQYDGDLQLPSRFLVEPPDIERTLGEYLARNRMSQFACSETQKFGHVTYFWNGNRSGAFDTSLERYVEIPSDVIPFEQRPWMKAAEIADATIQALHSGAYRHLRINFANGDMVGHTGDRDAAICAVSVVDLCLGRLLPVIGALQGAIIVTADHGNADQMFEIDKSGRFVEDDQGPKAKTSHTLNAVPCHIWAGDRRLELAGVVQPGLANIAATVLQLLGKESPADFEPSLLR